MENRIIIDKVLVSSNRIEVYYTIKGEINKYFNQDEKCFWVEYTEDVSSVPESIAVIPFVCNVLPIAWLSDAELVVNELDEEFYHSLFEVKHGYMLLSRMLEFKGKVIVNHIVNNRYEPTKQSAVLFSGGVDAFTTLFRHLDENPVMITLRGADVKLSDVEGWKVVSEHVESTAKTFDLPQPEFVTSNFRMFINEGELGDLCSKSGDGWWHGYQHGIGIIGHTAPLAYLKQMRVIYIASSFTWEFPYIIASDPVIDSHLKIANSEVSHDGYFMGRMDKIKYIVEKTQQTGKKVNLRVCWSSTGGHNCCECEKCIRTIFGIIAAGGKTADFGFNVEKSAESNFKSTVINALNRFINIHSDWHSIQNFIQSNDTFIEKNNPNYSWIYTIDIDKTYSKPSSIRLCFRNLKKLARKVIK